MSAVNTLLVLDAFIAAANAASKAAELIQRARSENRDVSDEEIESLRQQRITVIDILNKTP